MPLKCGVVFYLAVSLVCTVVDCRPRDEGVKNVKGVKALPPAARLFDGEYKFSHNYDGNSSFASAQSSSYSSSSSGSFKSGPMSSTHSGSISSSSGQSRSLTQAASSSISSSESGSFSFGGPSGSSSHVGGSRSDHLGSSSHFGSSETSYGSEIHGVAGSGSTDDGTVSGSHILQESSELGRGSDTWAVGTHGEAKDHDVGLGGISAKGGLGTEGHAESGAGSATESHGGDGSGAASHRISGNTDILGSGVAGSHEFSGSRIKISGGGEAHRKGGSRGLSSVDGTGTLGLDIHGDIDAKIDTASHGVDVSGSGLMGGAGIHRISGNTEHGSSGVAESHGLGGSGVTNAGSAGVHRVRGSAGHDVATKTGVRRVGVKTRCSSGRRVGNVGEPGDDERGGHGAVSENGAPGLSRNYNDKSGDLFGSVSGHKGIITGTDGFVLDGAYGGSRDAPEESETKDAGVLAGSAHGFGFADSAVEKTDTSSGSSSEAHSRSSSASGVDSVNNIDSGRHAGSGSQPGVSGSGSSSSSSHSSSGSEEVKGRKKLPAGVKG